MARQGAMSPVMPGGIMIGCVRSCNRMAHNNLDKVAQHFNDVKKRISEQTSNQKLKSAAQDFIQESHSAKYSYNFTWLGRPIIQYPEDILAVQEIIWKCKPDIIIETGVAHGGSLILSSSLLSLLDIKDGILPSESKKSVIGIDIDIRDHNRIEIENHYLSSKINLIEGSSIDESIVDKVDKLIWPGAKVMVFLDSNHSHEHVLRELELYSRFVSQDSYLVVFDTVVEELPKGSQRDRPWDVGNNPMTALKEWLPLNSEFQIDISITNKILITVARDGYLYKC